jgi:hypothetical protein
LKEILFDLEYDDDLPSQQLEIERKKEETRQRELLQQEFQKEFNSYKAYGTLPASKILSLCCITSQGTDAVKSLDQVEIPTDPSVEDFLKEDKTSTLEKKVEEVPANPPATTEEDEEETPKVEIIPDEVRLLFVIEV